MIALEEEKKKAESLEVTLNVAANKTTADVKPIPPISSGIAKDGNSISTESDDNHSEVSRIENKM